MSPRPRSVLVSLVLALGLAAQDPAPVRTSVAPLVPPTSALDGFAAVSDQGPEVLAVGRRWRARFDERSLEYRPALGKAAPRCYPLRIELQSVHRDGSEVDFAKRPVERRVDRESLRIDFARPGLVERYEARPEGLAQSLVFEARPAGSGDLVARFAVATDLALTGSTEQSVSWRARGLGGVELAGVLGLDALKRTVRGSVKPTASGYELRLPGWFVDAATYPLVLDPLLGPVSEGLAGYDVDFPDAAYEPFADAWALGWTMYSGGGASDAVGALFRASDNAQVMAFVINQSGDEEAVRVTSIQGMGVFVFAWHNLPPGGNALRIATMTLEPTQPAASQVYVIGNGHTPQLSGEATPYDDDCLVVWEDDQAGVVGASLQVNPDLTMAMTQPIVIGGGPDATEIAISKQGGDVGMHVVTWIDRPPGMPGWLRAQVVDHDMNPMGPGAWLQNVPLDAGYPAVDGDGFHFFAAWEQQEAQNPAAVDVLGRTFTVGAGGITSLGQVFDVAVYPGDLDGMPDVARIGERYGVVYQSGSSTQVFVDDCYYRTFTRAGAPIGPEFRLDVTITGNYAYEHAPRIVSKCDGDAASTSDHALVAFADQDNRSAESNVGLQKVEAMGPGGAVVDLGGGCGPAGLCAVRGPCALGNDAFAIDLHGAQPLAVPFLAVGFAGRPMLSCGVCSLVDPHLFQFWPSTSGSATGLLPIPGDAALVGLALELQWAAWNVAYVGCPVVPGVAVSNRVRATIGF